MKEIVALLFLVGFSVPTVWLALKGKAKGPIATIVLSFSIIGAFMIANYDIIQKVSGAGFEVETAKRELSDTKNEAIAAIKKDVDLQKESIRALISSANETEMNIQQQKQSLDEIVKVANDLKSNIETQRKAFASLNSDATKTKEEIARLNQASAEIALVLVKATYLTLETKSEFGTDRSKKAIETIFADLNALLPRVIPSEAGRAEYIKSLQDLLPARTK